MIYYLGLLGVSVFAISGALAADRKDADIVGALCLSIATALGGGTIRDLLLQRDAIFWIADPTYLWVVIASTVATAVFVRYFKPPTNALLYADALGLAMFTILGAKIAENHAVAPIIVVAMGVITGVAGGIIRDTLINEIPLLFRSSEPIYSVAAASGAIVYLVAESLDLKAPLPSALGVAVIIAARFAAIVWKIRLPEFAVRKR